MSISTIPNRPSRRGLLLEARDMKYLMFIKHAEDTGRVRPPKALNDAMGEFVGRMFASGALKDTGGLKPTSQAYRIRSSGGKLQVIDGPFAETKEVIGGGGPGGGEERGEGGAGGGGGVVRARGHRAGVERGGGGWAGAGRWRGGPGG